MSQASDGGVPELVDPFGRRIEYLRLSVTDRCDLRCHYCMPGDFRDFEEPDHWLTFEEMERLAGAFTELGVSRIRLTGGEPLTRQGLPELAARLGALPGLDDLSMTTNATNLARYAESLRAAGMRRLNVSLDTLDPERFRRITRHGRLERVLAGLDAAAAAGFDFIKINMVVEPDNRDEVGAMVDYCLERGFTLRFIETMPMGDTGHSGEVVPLTEVKAEIEERFDTEPAVMPGGGPADYLHVKGTRLRIGFITPISRHFCGNCNRVRLSVDGTLFLCLGQDNQVSFREMLRAGADRAELQGAIRAAIEHKPESHEFVEQPGKVMRFMNMTGG